MASEKQIAANRANAKRSTGPKTLVGKMTSSRNAYRHGLSVPLRPDPATSAKIDAIALALAGEQASEDRFTSAVDYVRVQFELLRIRFMRAELMAKAEIGNIGAQELRRLAALDRPERYCLTRRRRASRGL
jgi:hypothetical protein